MFAEIKINDVLRYCLWKSMGCYNLRRSYFVFILFFTITSYAQVVGVKASTDKNVVLLGEPFWLTLEIKTLHKSSPNTFKIDSLEHFEFIVKDSTSVIQTNDTTIFRQHYQLVSFDSGKWVIPSFTLRPFVKTNSMFVEVAFTENFNPNQPYHDVQKIKDVPFIIDASVERWWYPIALLLILITLIIYWLTSNKKTVLQSVNTLSDTAYKKALRSLKMLKESKVDEKEYYAQLVEVFRTYVEERTGISSLQQTSNDIVKKLKYLFNNEVKYNNLSQVLLLCDYVKFAKYHPNRNETNAAFEVIESTIHYIEAELKGKTHGDVKAV